MPIFARLATLTEEFATIMKERKLPRDVQETKLRAWKLAYEYQALEARFPVLKAELQEAVDTLEKRLHPAVQPASPAPTMHVSKAAPGAKSASTARKGSEKK